MATNLNNKLKRLYILASRLKAFCNKKRINKPILKSIILTIGEVTFKDDKKTLKDDFDFEIIFEASDKTYGILTLDHDELAKII